ncbi:MAG TPA: hypothetical protein VKA98_00575 [Nitrososphaeraceae archaeon]|nr:hypothetical protein [Nitrososphaeraceae archaeon]
MKQSIDVTTYSSTLAEYVSLTEECIFSTVANPKEPISQSEP